MKKLLLLLSMLALSQAAQAMERISGYCQQGGKVVIAPAVLGGVPLSRSFQQSYPRCTVTVFVTGSGGTLAKIYSANNITTQITNPMQADVNGFFDFYVPSCNQRYDVQISGGGLAAPFTFGDNLVLDLFDCTLFTGKLVMNGFASTGGKYDDFSSSVGGALFRSQNIMQGLSGLNGGYIKLSPITYNPNDGPPVFDIYGNPVRDPVMLPGDTLGAHDAVLFVGEATDMIPNPDLVMGIFTNVYMFSRVGFATDYASEASFQSLNGGMQALSFAAVNYVNSGQHAGVPPLTTLDQFHPGAIYYDTSLGCERVYSGVSWSCMGSGGGGGGSAAGGNTQVQFNAGGALAASANFTFNPGLQLLNVIAPNPTSAAINAQVGFIQSSGGFISANSSIQSIQAPSGGMNAVAFAAVSYVQTGNSTGVPTPVVGDSYHAGAMFWDLSTACEKLFNGTVWSCLGSGGSGSPGGTNTNVQFNSGGSFGGTGNFTWNNSGQLLNVVALSAGVAGINVQTGFIQSAVGFVAVPASATTYNAVSAVGGGMAAKSFTALKYVQVGSSSGAPTPSGGDTLNAGTLYWDTSATCLEVNNGAGFSCLGTGGSTSPGGSNTNVQFNASGAFSGTGNFTWTNASQLLNIVAVAGTAGINVQQGYMQSALGFVAVPGSATTYNAVSALGGGMAAISFTAQTYIQTGTSSGIPTPTAGDGFHPGALYWDTPSVALKVFNGSSWITLSGGGGSPGGSTNAVQFNSAGAFGGSSNFTWDNGAQLLNISAASSANAGINVQVGYIQSAVGFISPSATTFNAFQAAIGGMFARSFTAATYMHVGNNSGVPTPTSGETFHPGALYWDLSLGQLQVFNGSSFIPLSGGGGGGSPGGADNNVQFNSSGAFAGSPNLAWFNTGRLLNINGSSNSVAALNIQTGFAQSAGGFSTSASTFNALQAPTGGLFVRSITAQTYSSVGESFGLPTLTPGDAFHPGSIFWNQGTSELWLYTNGASGNWVPEISSTGAFIGPAVNSATGAFGGITFGNSISPGGSTNIFGGGVLITGSITMSNVVNFSSGAVITPPSGAALNGAVTCGAGQHVSSISFSQGFAIGVSCSL